MSATQVSTNDSGDLAANARALNDAIAKGAKAFRDEQMPYDFFCECGEPSCRAIVRLSVARYDAIRTGSILAHAHLSRS